MRKLKGFSLRRPGRPSGSRAVDRNQSDIFALEKFLSQCGFKRGAASRPQRSEDVSAAQPLPPATNRGGKFEKANLEGEGEFCDF